MKWHVGAMALVALWSCGYSSSASATEPGGLKDISGQWELSLVTFGEKTVRRLKLQTAGDRISGQSGAMKVNGHINGDTIDFEIVSSDGKVFGRFAGTLKEDGWEGDGKVAGGPASWTAQRPAVRPPEARHKHDFQPQEYPRAFSYAFPPVLRVFPGDTVRTKTIDALGLDENLVRRGNEGNPLTGPFYVEGALAGDTLVVHFNRIRLNRDSAISGHKIYPVVVTSDYAARIKPVDSFDSRWVLDRENNTARLLNPTAALKDLVVPIHPTLGCVGVAPRDQQSWSAHQLGDFGGNLDYNQIREGTTLYLPVFHSGALLFFGDGHAVQGDGELAALETSLDVEFTVDVIADDPIEFPRAENDEFLMTMGIAGSLTAAIQEATTELMKWLERDYHLNAAELAIVLGTGVRYDVAEIVDPQLHVVAKVSKSVLSQLHEGEP